MSLNINLQYFMIFGTETNNLCEENKIMKVFIYLKIKILNLYVRVSIFVIVFFLFLLTFFLFF